MRAVDTNVLIRLVTGDDRHQEGIVLALMQDSSLFVSLSVILETEWVLRSHYRWSRTRIAIALSELVVLDGIDVERVSGILWAIQRMSEGADFADMIHLIAAGDAEAFATFDRDIARVVGESSPIAVQILS